MTAISIGPNLKVCATPWLARISHIAPPAPSKRKAPAKEGDDLRLVEDSLRPSGWVYMRMANKATDPKHPYTESGVLR